MSIQEIANLLIDAGIEKNEANAEVKLLLEHFCNFKTIDILFGKMFLTYKNYKYGIVGYDGKVILENEFDDIYMPKPNVMRILYNGQWYELEQVNAETLSLPADAKHNLATKEDLNFYNIVVNTGAMTGYSVLTFSDYLIKIFSSISNSFALALI